MKDDLKYMLAATILGTILGLWHGGGPLGLATVLLLGGITGGMSVYQGRIDTCRNCRCHTCMSSRSTDVYS